jgi:chemotaxis protein CheD
MEASGPDDPSARGSEAAVAKEVTIHIGGVHAAADPTVIKTLLGSCIAVCLWDPVAGVGGMNHFMLPHGGEDGRGEDATRFGVHAMDVLIGDVMKAGGDRRRCVAKVFGGAHVLDIRESADGVPQKNIEFVRAFLAAESVRILSEDVGGYLPRHVHFFTLTGRARVRRLRGLTTQTQVVARERQRQPRPAQYGGVMLFEEGR